MNLYGVIDNLNQPFRQVCRKIFSYPEFLQQIGGIRHHEYNGGLLNHTSEVVRYCFETLQIRPDANKNILITAAIWHDLGKIWEYEYKDSVAVKTDKGEKLHHIYTSISEFTYHAINGGMNKFDIDQVNHCIAAHHYYTPARTHHILPQTLEALILCNCDHMSAMFGETK